MKSALIVAFLVLAVTIVYTEGECLCRNTDAGKHCGYKPGVMSGCKSRYIYQCNGQLNSPAHEYGPCRKGCVYKGDSLDYCRTWEDKTFWPCWQKKPVEIYVICLETIFEIFANCYHCINKILSIKYYIQVAKWFLF